LGGFEQAQTSLSLLMEQSVLLHRAMEPSPASPSALLRRFAPVAQRQHAAFDCTPFFALPNNQQATVRKATASGDECGTIDKPPFAWLI
jgi:hypothetical protein